MGGRFGVRAGVGPVVALALVALASAPLADPATALAEPAAVDAGATAVAAEPAAVVADPTTSEAASVSDAAADVPDAAADVAQPPAAVAPGVTLRTAVYEVEQLLDRDGRVERRLLPALDLVAGDELRYVITVRNETGRRVEPGRIEVRVAVPADTRLLPGSAGGAGTLVEYALGAGAFSPHLPILVEAPEPESAAAAPSGPEAAPEPVGETDGEQAAGAAAPPPEPGAAATAGPVDQPPGEPGGVVQPAAGGAAQTVDPAASSVAPPDAPSADAGPVSIRWTYQQPLEPMAATELFFHVRLE